MATEKLKSDGILRAGGILDRIVDRRLERLEEARQLVSQEDLIARCAAMKDAAPSFREALSRTERINIIAEIKRQSPSKGVIREDFNHLAIAEAYATAGAAAMSVLTEEDFFGGSLRFLTEIHQRVDVPLLRKDFIIDEYQIYEAKAAGASAMLLITAILNDELLTKFIQLAEEVNLDALVEVHSETEMRRAAAVGAKLIGVNNRDLTTFKVDLETSLHLAGIAPDDALLVSESGITSREDIQELRAAGYQAFLIGEHFMLQNDVGAALRKLVLCNE